MKKAIVTLLLASGLSFVSHAQTTTPAKPGNDRKEHRKNMSPDERSAKDAGWAEKKLGLNADQKAKWQAASLERIRANEPLKEKMNGSTTPEERMELRKQMKSNRDRFESTVSVLLSPEQKTKFDAAKNERHHKRHEHMKKGMNTPSDVNPK